MQAREDFHKVARRGLAPLLILLVIGLTSTACRASEGSEPGEPPQALLAESPLPARAGPPAGYAWVVFGADTVLAEVATTAEERADGLMYRDAVPEGTGMLFVFPDSQVRSFWMANTYVPLDLAYMDPSFRIVDIVQMEPLVTDSYMSSAPAMYGLEVRQGWFADEGIQVGAQAEIVFGAPAR